MNRRAEPHGKGFDLLTTGSPVTGPNLGWAFDTMGRLNTMTDLATSSSIITSATYGPSNELLTISGVSGLANSESRTYNSMLQLTQLTVSNWSGNLINLTYTYSSSQNNGKITGQTDAISGETVQYTYDSLNRLATAQATSGSWGQSYAYDGFGNLTDQNVIAGSAPAYHTVMDPSTNHPTSGYGSVDANGNLLSVAPWTVAYDSMNRMAGSAGNFQYSYAPNNKRVWRGVWTSGTLTTDEVTFWSVTGQKLGTYQLNVSGATMYPSQTGTNYYYGAKLIKNAGGYVGADRLGSIGHFYPYAQEKPSATANDTEKFTGYVRDSETGLDYANNRFHNPGTGRFLTPDPYMASGGPGDPGSWNRYAYTRGDPINSVDRAGTCDEPLERQSGLVAHNLCDPGEDPDPEPWGGDTDDGSSVNYTNNQIIGYDTEGNPIFGGTDPQVVTVNADGDTITITFGSASCPAGQVVVNGVCDVPIYGISGSGQRILASVSTNTSAIESPCFIAGWNALAAAAAAISSSEVWGFLAERLTPERAIGLVNKAATGPGRAGPMTAVGMFLTYVRSVCTPQ